MAELGLDRHSRCFHGEDERLLPLAGYLEESLLSVIIHCSPAAGDTGMMLRWRDGTPGRSPRCAVGLSCNHPKVHYGRFAKGVKLVPRFQEDCRIGGFLVGVDGPFRNPGGTPRGNTSRAGAPPCGQAATGNEDRCGHGSCASGLSPCRIPGRT